MGATPAHARAQHTGVTSHRRPGAVTRLGYSLALLPRTVLGCYTYTPLSTSPQPGAEIALDLNDRGRLGLADSLGPEVGRVEGRLIDRSDSALVVRVSDVIGLRGRRARWSGEPVTLRTDYLSAVAERQFSKQRTAVVVGSAAAAVIAFIATRSLLGSGSQGGQPGGGGGQQTARVPVHRPPVLLWHTFGLRLP